MDSIDNIFWIIAGVPATLALAGTLSIMHGPFGLSVIIRAWFVVFFGGAKWAQAGVSCIVCLSLWAAMIVAAAVADAIGGLRGSQYGLLVLFSSGLVSWWAWHFFGFKTPTADPPSVRAVVWTKRMQNFWKGIYFYEWWKSKRGMATADKENNSRPNPADTPETGGDKTV